MSLSTHKTSANTLAQPKPTSRVIPELPSASGTKKRKKKEDLVITTDTDPGNASAGPKRFTKKAKLEFHDGNNLCPTPVTKLKPEKKKKTKGDKDLMPEVVKTGGKPGEEAVKDRKGKKKQVTESVLPGDEEENEMVEDSKQNPSSSDSEEDDGEYVPPLHESLAGTAGPDSASSSKKSKKYVPPEETPGQRDSRTIFVGNVPSQVMTTKVSWLHMSLSEMLINWL